MATLSLPLLALYIVASLTRCGCSAWVTGNTPYYCANLHAWSNHQLASRSCSRLGARRRNRSAEDDEDNRQNDGGAMPMLPPTSGLPKSSETAKTQSTADPIKPSHVTTRKLQLQYTCNICETRNVHKVSRSAYRKGVVIAQCQGCHSQHLIADHLGFTKLLGTPGNLEDNREMLVQKKQGEEQADAAVLRVSPEVFDLERRFAHDTSSGAILSEGEDGPQKSLE